MSSMGLVVVLNIYQKTILSFSNINMPNENECRTCGHCWELHDHHGVKRCYQNMGEDYGSPDLFCDCNTGWVPGDNLQFLEMKYERNKLAIESRNKSNEDMPTQ